jgi:hypothetical protein
MDKHEMGYIVAKRDYFTKLEEYNLLSERKSNRDLKARKVIPTRVEDVPPEVIKLLKKRGYSETDISNALNTRLDRQSALPASESITEKEAHDTEPEADIPQALLNGATGKQPVVSRKNKRRNKKRR